MENLTIEELLKLKNEIMQNAISECDKIDMLIDMKLHYEIEGQTKLEL